MPTYNPGKSFVFSSHWQHARKQPTTGKVRKHEGQDWAAPKGTPIPAAADGTVIANCWFGGYGNVIALEHQINGKTVHTMYAHMHERSPLAVGAKVKAGQSIGGVGMTGGVSSGNHLHFEVTPDAEAGKFNLHRTVDPATFDFPVGTEARSGSWSYPFLKNDGKEASHIGIYIDALRLAEDGFYPIGANCIWHGGIHFDASVGNKLALDRGVRCISDGEVVAYRLNRRYRAIQYSPANKFSVYSTGFVLVRHKLVLPESAAQHLAPTHAGLDNENGVNSLASSRQAEIAANASLALSESSDAQVAKGGQRQKPEPENLVFYSLYMHLLDWQGYEDNAKLSRPPFWQGKKRYRVGDKAAEDKQRVPATAAQVSTADIFGSGPSLVDGVVTSWLEAPEADVFREPPVVREVGLNVREAPNGKLVCLLAKDAEVRISEVKQVGRGSWGKISEMVAGRAVSAVVDDTPRSPVGNWVYLSKLEVIFEEPDPFDSVVVLKEPFRVTAGTVLGYLGEYQRRSESMAAPQRGLRPMLHLEVFSGGDVPGFIGRSRAYAANRPLNERTLLVIESGAQLVPDPKADFALSANETVFPTSDAKAGDRWIPVRRVECKIVEKATLGTYAAKANPFARYGSYAGGEVFVGEFVGSSDEKVTHDEKTARKLGYSRRKVLIPIGPVIWVERTAWSRLRNNASSPKEALAAWSNYPLQVSNTSGPANKLSVMYARAELDGLSPSFKVIAPQDRRWWKVSTGEISGWVCDKDHPKVAWQSPWAWPGYEFVEEGDLQNLDMFSWGLHALGNIFAGEAADFKARADKVLSSSLHKQVYSLLDLDKNGNLTPSELQHAQTRSPLTRHLQRLVARYESEWAGPMAKWDVLDPLMRDDRAEWQAEKIRIKELQFWAEMSALKQFPVSPWLYHFHPLALVANFGGAQQGPAMAEGEVMYLARTLYGEARGQNYPSKLAVAWVIRNRVATGRWGKSYRSVVTAKLQFTCWSKRADPHGYAAIHNPKGLSWEDCLKAAREVMEAPDSANPIPSVTHYFSPNAQRQLNAKNPEMYPYPPPFTASPSIKVNNPVGVDGEDYAFYKNVN